MSLCYSSVCEYVIFFAAYDDYTCALRIDPTSANAWHNRGDMYCCMDLDLDFHILVRVLGSSLEKLHRNSEVIWNFFCLCVLVVTHRMQALHDFTRAIQLESDNSSRFVTVEEVTA